MKHSPAISRMKRQPGTVEDLEDQRDALADFLTDMRHAADREDDVFSAWAAQQFYARFYHQLQKPGTFADAVDRVMSQDLPELCRELEAEAQADRAEERVHNTYCRSMVGRGSGW